MRRPNFLPLALLLLQRLSASAWALPPGTRGPHPARTVPAAPSRSLGTMALAASPAGDLIDARGARARGVVVVPRRDRLSPLLRRQEVVLKTSAVVAAVAFATGGLPLPHWSQRLRGNMLAGTLIFMAGDWGAQLLTHRRDVQDGRGAPSSDGFRVDGSRFVISTVLGALWAGVANPGVYAMAERLLPGTSPRLVLTKMAVTCSILSTAGNYVTMLFRRFFRGLWEARGRGAPRILAACARTCRDDFGGVLRDDLKVWPLYDVLCFSVIPPRARPLTNALMASAWAMYMSVASAEGSE